MRTYRYLEIDGVKYPCRRTDGMSFGGDAFLNVDGITHSASVPLNNKIVIESILTDERGLTYRVVDAIEGLGKLRLKLERF